jgi:hypothetical protein
VIEDSYNDYISKEAMARQISLTAQAYIKYRESNLEDWLRVFADEDIVISKLKAL